MVFPRRLRIFATAKAIQLVFILSLHSIGVSTSDSHHHHQHYYMPEGASSYDLDPTFISSHFRWLRSARKMCVCVSVGKWNWMPLNAVWSGLDSGLSSGFWVVWKVYECVCLPLSCHVWFAHEWNAENCAHKWAAIGRYRMAMHTSSALSFSPLPLTPPSCSLLLYHMGANSGRCGNPQRFRIVMFALHVWVMSRACVLMDSCLCVCVCLEQVCGTQLRIRPSIALLQLNLISTCNLSLLQTHTHTHILYVYVCVCHNSGKQSHQTSSECTRD